MCLQTFLITWIIRRDDFFSEKEGLESDSKKKILLKKFKKFFCFNNKL